jgi:DNA-binding transcriptional LysR family regulator
MDRLTSMSVFVKVVAHHSFAGAARESGLSRAGVSKHVLALEQSLGVRLLNRNTRRLSLTEVGAVVHERYAQILEEIDEVERNAGALQINPRAPFGSQHRSHSVSRISRRQSSITWRDTPMCRSIWC